MAKSFKRFREEREDDEWCVSEDDHVRKDRRMESRRNKRRNKMQEQEKYSTLDDSEESG